MAAAPVLTRVSRLAFLLPISLSVLPVAAQEQPDNLQSDAPASAAAPEATSAAESATVPIDTAAPAESTRNASGSRLVEEIVVTAQKREENLQDVPISVAAFSGDALEARGIDDPTALAQITPGLVYSSLLGYSLIFIRGVGSDAFEPTADQSVATYIDGVYLPFGHGLAQSFVPLERVEILKGPQGTLFGRNATGGAINIITKKPSPTFQGSFEGSYGKFDDKQAKAFVTGPIVGSLYGSASLLYTNEDSYYHLTPDSFVRNLHTDTTKGVSGRLQWDITDTLSTSASALITRFNGTGAIVNSAEDVKPLGQVAGVQPEGVREASLDVQPYLGVTNDLYYGNFQWAPDGFDVKLLGSHQEVHTNTNYDFDASKENLVNFSVPDQFSKTTTAELQFLSKTGGIFPNWAQLTSGLYYYQSDAGYAKTNLQVADLDHLAALELPPALQPLVETVVQPFVNGLRSEAAQASAAAGLPVPTNGVTLALVGHVKTEAYAAYAQSTFYVTDWFDVTAGLRYQAERRGVRTPQAALSTASGPVTLLSYADKTTDKYSLSPKVTLDFKPFEHQLIYLTASEAEKSGTYNLPAIYTPPSYVKPEKIRAYEIGNKGEFLHGTFRYSAALFDSQISDLQTQIVSLVSGGAQNLVNAAKAEIKGADADITWQALPDLLPGFVLTASGAYLDGEFKSFPNASGFDPTTGLYFGRNSLVLLPGRDFSGNRTVRTPKYTASVGPNFAFEIPDGTIEAGMDVSYNSGFFFDTQNTAAQPSYVLLNGRLSYLYEPAQLRVTVYGKNLTGANYYVNRFPTDFATNSTWASSVEFGMRVGVEF